MFCYYLWFRWLLLLPCSPSSNYNLPNLQITDSQLINNVASGKCTGLHWNDYVAVARAQLVSALRLCKALTSQVFHSSYTSERLSSKNFWENCDVLLWSSLMSLWDSLIAILSSQHFTPSVWESINGNKLGCLN